MLGEIETYCRDMHWSGSLSGAEAITLSHRALPGAGAVQLIIYGTQLLLGCVASQSVPKRLYDLRPQPRTGRFVDAQRADQIETMSRDAVWFEDVVSKSYQRARESQAKVIGRLEVENEFETAWLFKGQFARLGPAQHARCVGGEAPIDFDPVDPIRE
jgi:hypothetical protein